MRSAVAIFAVLAAATIGLSGCGSTVSAASATSTWASQNSFAQGVTDLLGESAGVQAAVDHYRSAKDVFTNCAEAFNDANGENTDWLPTPDDQLTNLLSTALDQFVHAAGQCDDASGDRAVLTTVLREDRRAVGALIAAVLREEALTGRSAGVAGVP